MKIDWAEQLRRYLQVLAFALAISALLYTFSPNRPYEIGLIYSLCISTLCWAFTDFGRFFLKPDPETQWPKGWRMLLLIVLGTVGGWLGGTGIGDMWFGWSSWDQSPNKLRSDWAFTVVAGIVISYYFYSQGKSSSLQAKFAQAQRQAAEAHAQAAEAQLKLLQAQLDPHMLFNTLANLRVLIGINPVAAQDMLDRMIAYLRATLSASRATAHPLHVEFERLNDYLALMAVRMGPRLLFTLDLPDDLRDVPVPTLLLQPLVENSIQHGLEPQVQGGKITVRASSKGTQLMLEVTDTGMGLQHNLNLPDTSTGGIGGFGLAQVRARLHTAYGTLATVELTAPAAGGTSATLTFPLHSGDTNRHNES